MPVSAGYREFVRDLLAPLGPVQIRALFGGCGIFLDDVMFGLIFDEQIYLKVDDANRLDYQAAGQPQFTYPYKDGATASMSYYSIPDALYDDPEELSAWAAKAFAVANRAVLKKSNKPQRKKPKVKKPSIE